VLTARVIATSSTPREKLGKRVIVDPKSPNFRFIAAATRC